jgi:hypothetical protein
MPMPREKGRSDLNAGVQLLIAHETLTADNSLGLLRCCLRRPSGSMKGISGRIQGCLRGDR